MKYKEVYAVLNHRRASTPGFRHNDRSGWHNGNSYIDRIRPLWIIVEDPVAGWRIWITQEGTDMEITVGEMDVQGRNEKTLRRFPCKTKTELAERLCQLFSKEASTIY